ncbi:3-sulfolactaldehyde reductase [uncultured archaeon]|nr:3-sulfolactaldehyde reductase [uncultured archaeon]
MHAGFIGLGVLGKAIARRLLAQGVELKVWNRTVQKAEDLGVEIAKSPADLISRVPVVILNLFDSDAVSTVLEGNDRLLRGDCQGKLIVDTTTNHFQQAARFHELAASRGCQYIEAPVLGSVLPASQGALCILVSGKASAYETALPYLQKMGKEIFFLEEHGLATKMKLVNNLVLGNFMATIAEAVVMGEKIGLEKETVMYILASGAGNSGVLSAKRQKLLTEDFSAHFSAALIYKDLHYLQDLAMESKRPLFTPAMTKELYAMMFSKNMDKLDFSAVYRLLKEI